MYCKIHICKRCNNEYEAHSNRSFYCKDCLKPIDHYATCPICKENFIIKAGNKGHPKYCSKNCCKLAAKLRNAAISKENKKDTLKLYSCRYCNKIVEGSFHFNAHVYCEDCLNLTFTCKCGCGTPINFKKYIIRNSQYVVGHGNSGTKYSEESKKKMSEVQKALWQNLSEDEKRDKIEKSLRVNSAPTKGQKRSEEFKKKQSIAMKERYKDEIFLEKMTKHIEASMLSKETIIERLSIKSPRVQILTEFLTINDDVKCKNIDCNHEWESKIKYLLNGVTCAVCRKSKGEKIINEWLLKNHIEFVSQKRFENCRNKKPLPFDFYLPEQNLCIEYDGEQHFISMEFFGGENGLNRNKQIDKIKTEYCHANNINLLRIPYWNKDIIEDCLNAAILIPKYLNSLRESELMGFLDKLYSFIFDTNDFINSCTIRDY